MKKIFTKQFIKKLVVGQIFYYLIMTTWMLAVLMANQMLYPACDLQITEKICKAFTPFIFGHIWTMVIMFSLQVEKVYNLSKCKLYAKFDSYINTFETKYPIFCKWLNIIYMGLSIIVFITISIVVIFHNPCQ